MKKYFSGIYFKQRGENGAVALIPAIHQGADGQETASIQIVTEQGSHCVWFGNETQGDATEACFGNSRFSLNGIHLDVESSTVIAAGDLRFRDLTPPRTDAMGLFRFVPFMECRHAVYSLRHAVDGCLTINGRTYFFDGGEGYIEGDEGRSFPAGYLWTQCTFGRGSIMLSVAEIPFAGMQFTGVLGIVLYGGRQYRIATDRGAKVEQLGERTICVRQGKLRLTAELLSIGGAALKAPAGGDMTRIIREQLRCRARYKFERDGKTIFCFTSDTASFESEY